MAFTAQGQAQGLARLQALHQVGQHGGVELLPGVHPKGHVVGQQAGTQLGAQGQAGRQRA